MAGSLQILFCFGCSSDIGNYSRSGNGKFQNQAQITLGAVNFEVFQLVLVNLFWDPIGQGRKHIVLRLATETGSLQPDLDWLN
ncbi:hypothetical protein VNO77_39032 [Canavalia gladiata]|uniref:Uncharacterized protein n=1 Tax=Canavalia gladiata TaxID=3824 RepID=A0AAN9KAB3_CANGL